MASTTLSHQQKIASVTERSRSHKKQSKLLTYKKLK